MLFGYVRVSTKDQNTDRQVKALLEHGVTEENIFVDKQSGKDFDRENYNLLLKIVREGDTIIIKELDRFGRNYAEIKDNFKRITDKGVHINVLDMPILNTNQVIEGNLTMKFISDVVLTVLGYVAEQERANIKVKQAEGIRRAKERKTRFGRPTKDKQVKAVQELLNKHKQKDLPLTIEQACQQVGIARRTYYNHIGTQDNVA